MKRTSWGARLLKATHLPPDTSDDENVVDPRYAGEGGNMFLAIRERLERGREEGGFTLIELMVVVLIIAILIAIAIPTFLGARRRAQDKQAQSNLRNALTAEKTYYVDTQAFTNVAADLTAIESSLDFGTDNGWVRGALVEELDAAGNWVVLRSESRSGTFFCIQDIATGATAGTYYANAAAADCPAGGAVAGWDADAGTGW
jgi:type IV pilus assembly protein PilA